MTRELYEESVIKLDKIIKDLVKHCKDAKHAKNVGESLKYLFNGERAEYLYNQVKMGL